MFSRTLKALLLSSMLTGCVLAGRPAAAQGTSAANINRALDTLNRIAQLIDSIQNRQTTQVSELERSDYLTP